MGFVVIDEFLPINSYYIPFLTKLKLKLVKLVRTNREFFCTKLRKTNIELIDNIKF